MLYQKLPNDNSCKMFQYYMIKQHVTYVLLAFGVPAAWFMILHLAFRAFSSVMASEYTWEPSSLQWRAFLNIRSKSDIRLYSEGYCEQITETELSLIAKSITPTNAFSQEIRIYGYIRISKKGHNSGNPLALYVIHMYTSKP